MAYCRFVPVSGGGGGSSSLAIGEAITGGTATRVLFEGAGPVLADDAGLTYASGTASLSAGRFLAATSGAVTPGPGFAFQGFTFTGMYSPSSNIVALASGGDPRLAILASGTYLAQNTELSWCSTFFTATTILFQESAGFLGQKNSTNPTGYNWYNTYTDASNYERGSAGWAANVYTISTAAAGTGTARNIALTPAGGTVIVNGQLSAVSQDAAIKTIVVKAAAAQTALLQEWQNNAGTAILSVSSAGYIGNGIAALGATYPLDLRTKVSGLYARFGINFAFADAPEASAIGRGAFGTDDGAEVGLYNYAGSISFYTSAPQVKRFNIDATGAVTIPNATTTVVPFAVLAAPSQTAHIQDWSDNTGTPLSGITKNGGFSPASMTDAAAVNNTIYYSTDASKLVYKDSGGVVNNLY